VALYCCPYLCQLSINFQNLFTGTLCGQYTITDLLHIPPHRKRIFTLPCKILIKYAYTTIITNKHFGKIEKKTVQTNVAVNGLYDTKLCGSNAVYCHTDHSSQYWSEMFFHLPNFFVIVISFCLHLYFTTLCKDALVVW